MILTGLAWEWFKEKIEEHWATVDEQVPHTESFKFGSFDDESLLLVNIAISTILKLGVGKSSLRFVSYVSGWWVAIVTSGCR